MSNQSSPTVAEIGYLTGSQVSGLGWLGALIPVDALLYAEVTTYELESSELRFRITSISPGYSFQQLNEDSSAVIQGPDGTCSITYDWWVDGELQLPGLVVAQIGPAPPTPAINTRVVSYPQRPQRKVTMGIAKIVDPIDVAETDVLIEWDFSGDLVPAGVTINSVTFGVEVRFGVDPTPDALWDGEYSLDSSQTIVRRRIKGNQVPPVAGPKIGYGLRCVAVGSDSVARTAVALIEVHHL